MLQKGYQLNNINQAVRSGIKWTTIAQASLQIVRLLRWAVLIYLLSPTDFGVMAIALLIVGFPQLFLDEAARIFIVEQSSLTRLELNTAHWFTVFSSLIIFIFLYFLTPFFCQIFDSENLFLVLLIITFSSVIDSFGKVSGVVLQKELVFDYIHKLEIIASIIGTLFVTVVLAFLDFGVLSLAYGLIVRDSVIMIGNLLKRRDFIKLEFSFSILKKILSSTKFLILHRYTYWFLHYLDDLIIGLFFGKANLGIYDRAYQLVHLPMRLISGRVNAVLYPVYSANGSDFKEVKKVHFSVIRTAGAVFFVILAGTILFSDLTVRYFLKEEWWEMGVLLPLLAAGGIAQAFIILNESIFLARGRSDLQFKYGLITRLIVILSYVVGAYWGVRGIAIGYTVGSIIGFFPEGRQVLRLIDSGFGDLWNALSSSVSFFLIAITITSLIIFLINGLLFKLLVGFVVFIILCIAYLYVIFRKNSIWKK